jgi:mono/diheme cytochrome c family protein
VKLAPDLRYTRERFRPEVLTAWLRDPSRLKPDTLMPNLGLSEAQAQDIAAYLLREELAPAARVEVPVRLPILEREVTFAEVDEKIFSRTCRHCHGDADNKFRDGGPGNTGGFGFAPRRVSFSSHQAMLSGGLDGAGQRRSLFTPTADGTPLLIAVLEQRYREQNGSSDAKIRGMPLGMPALSPEDIQLIATWIAQGRRL